MKLAVIGTGYVGLVTGACFSEYGYQVTCIDRDEAKIAGLNAGRMPIVEPGLQEMVIRNAKAGRLHFTGALSNGVSDADIVFVAVGTPPIPESGMPDLRALEAVCQTLATCLKPSQLVVIKSTVPVGTTRRMKELLRKSIKGIETASNPEFLREGSAIEDFMAPDRIIAGADTEAAGERLMQLYAPITQTGAALFVTTPESSEMIKYAANSFLSTKVAFINEIADICEKVGANVREVAKGIGMDKRIGPDFLRAGPGIGGSCFPKDMLALTATAKQAGAPAHIIEAVIESNEVRKRNMAQKIIHALGKNVAGKTVAVLGLTFKPGTDDMRESPSLTIIPLLLEAGIRVKAYDPEGMEEAKKLLPHIVFCTDALSAMRGADALVILTEWNEFKKLDMAEVRRQLHVPLIIDLRNIYTRRDMQAAGFTYVSIGRATVESPQAEILDLAKPKP